MGVTRREQQMLDLAEAGRSRREIAQEMGLKLSSVERTLGLLNSGLGEERRTNQAIAAGSAQLRTAVLQQGGHR